MWVVSGLIWRTAKHCNPRMKLLWEWYHFGSVGATMSGVEYVLRRYDGRYAFCGYETHTEETEVSILSPVVGRNWYEYGGDGRKRRAMMLVCFIICIQTRISCTVVHIKRWRQNFSWLSAIQQSWNSLTCNCLLFFQRIDFVNMERSLCSS